MFNCSSELILSSYKITATSRPYTCTRPIDFHAT